MVRRDVSVLVLTDSPEGQFVQHLQLLYPERVTALNFVTEAHGPKKLGRYSHVVTMVTDGKNLGRLDYRSVRQYAQEGGQVASCLFEYAKNRRLTFSKTHVGNRMEPAFRVARECDITRGYQLGDEVWWYGAVSSAPDTLYMNQLVQRQILDVVESSRVTILGRSTVNGGAVMLEEQVGKGRIFASDLLSPGAPFFNCKGSTNKFLFLGNFIGGAVRYGKHYPRRLPYDQFVELMQTLAQEHERLQMVAEGPCSDGRQMWSLRLGDPANPTFYAGAAIHGWEWENSYGLLRLAEVLCTEPHVEGLDTTKLHFVLVPVQNPWGFDNFTRQNANGVDLNRNFETFWKELPMPQDVAIPWDYNYKGPRAASEPETQIIQGLIDRYRPRVAIDFHTADYILLVPHVFDEGMINGIQEDIKARLKDRYLCQAPYNGPYQQVNMDKRSERQRLPYLITYAAAQGTPAAFLIEMSGNRDDVHALVMNTDTVVEICLAAASNQLSAVRNQAAGKP